jgi:hypothetical protein
MANIEKKNKTNQFDLETYLQIINEKCEKNMNFSKKTDILFVTPKKI